MGVRVKICGVKNKEEIEIMNRHLPDYIGLVFAGTKRRIDLEYAAVLISSLDERIKKCGIFENEDIDKVILVSRLLNLDVVQLHGSESGIYIGHLRERTEAEIWKAVKIGTKYEPLPHGADRIILDSPDPGTGRSFSWSILTEYQKCMKDIVIAGGLGPDNVAVLLGKNSPYCVDVSTGVEKNGYKDDELVEKFIFEVRKMKKTTGRYGEFGGRYVPETLMGPLMELERNYNMFKTDESFQNELSILLTGYANRPSPLYFAKNLTIKAGGAKIYLKREDLNHTGSHKINNVLGQALLAKKCGKMKLVAETGAGQHGVASATAAALMGLECKVFMGSEDMNRQALNVFRMKVLGSEVIEASSGTGTLKDATNEAFRYWAANCEDTHYLLGSVVGPHPYPAIVRDFQSVIGKEVKKQIMAAEGRIPDYIFACVGGGSNAIGIFYEFINDDVKLIGCEAAGKGIHSDEHAASLAKGEKGVFHGMKSYFIQDREGQIKPVYSISAGLDYPGIGPEHAFLRDSGRAEYHAVTDEEALVAFAMLSETEGIIPAIESAHAVAKAVEMAGELPGETIIVVNISGRGDKDMESVFRYMNETGGAYA